MYKDKMSISEVLDRLTAFNPIKICFNNIVLYNDYDSKEEVEPGVFGEIESYKTVVPKRLKTALDNYDVLVKKFEVVIVQHHHSIVYLYGEKIRKGCYG